jgi:hypothetical protein
MQFATVQYQPLHPTEGSLMLYYDQMNVVTKHLQAAYTPHKASPQQMTSDGQPTDEGRVCTAISPTNTNASADNPDLGKSYTLRELKQRADWDEWRQARYTMLNSYQEQGMFSEPMAAPVEANIHHMLWWFVYKLCGTRKARMVCDGSARQGTITLGLTFANSLDTASERLFWAVVAHKNLVAYGADVSNAFAEAPPPAHPLYLRIDDTFRDWWENHLHRPPIPKHHTVVKVNNAIQGHPESPRLWEKLIDRILKTIGFKPTTHEPCLYYGIIKGNYTLFLRQVDDFAIATSTKQQATEIIQEINGHLHLPIHNLGVITRFNGMDIQQTRHYIKIHCHKYLTKMTQSHSWADTTKIGTTPLPFPSDSTSLTKLLTCDLLATTDDQKRLEKYMGLKYRHVMGEVLYPMVK